MSLSSLQNNYRETNENTLAQWARCAGIGEIREGDYYDPLKHALATGIQPAMPAQVLQLFAALKQLTGDDPLADLLPASSFHFTFLPLTLPLFEPHKPLPEEANSLKAIWAPYTAKTIIIRDLRLIALPSQLLLAGIPDEPAVAMRHAFCEEVLNSEWKNALLMRHKGSALPAPFWHSTLLRYGAAYLPPAVRAFFVAHQHATFGDVSGELTLARINYNWTTCFPLEG